MKRSGFNKSAGFSLIELIVVIVVLSILATFGAQFIVSSTQNYEQTRTRALLVNTGRQALEQMTRQLRGALPYSVIVTNNNRCLKFLPIAGGGSYLGQVRDQSNQAVLTGGNVATNTHGVEFGTAYYVSIGAMSAQELYETGGSLVVLPAPRSLGDVSNQLAIGNKVWARNSINRRFYLLDRPQAFCIVGTQLRCFPDAGMSLPSVDQGSNSDVMAENISATAPFTLTAGSENRNTIVVINIALTSGEETVDFSQQVMIRNVP